MDTRWYQNAVIYCVEIDVFRDGDGDGKGGFLGLTQGMVYLSGLGVNRLWLLPFFPSPDRGDGYDITDYLGVNPVYGDIGDFALFMDEAAEPRHPRSDRPRGQPHQRRASLVSLVPSRPARGARLAVLGLSPLEPASPRRHERSGRVSRQANGGVDVTITSTSSANAATTNRCFTRWNV